MREPTSVILEGLARGTPAEGVTLDWIVARLRERSFGIVMLLIGIVVFAALLSMVITAAALCGTIEARLSL